MIQWWDQYAVCVQLCVCTCECVFMGPRTLGERTTCSTSLRDVQAHTRPIMTTHCLTSRRHFCHTHRQSFPPSSTGANVQTGPHRTFTSTESIAVVLSTQLPHLQIILQSMSPAAGDCIAPTLLASDSTYRSTYWAGLGLIRPHLHLRQITLMFKAWTKI